MNGMQRKAAERRKRLATTEDGIQRNPKDWTVADWRDLHLALQAVRAKIAARHNGKAS